MPLIHALLSNEFLLLPPPFTTFDQICCSAPDTTLRRARHKTGITRRTYGQPAGGKCRCCSPLGELCRRSAIPIFRVCCDYLEERVGGACKDHPRHYVPHNGAPAGGELQERLEASGDIVRSCCQSRKAGSTAMRQNPWLPLATFVIQLSRKRGAC